MSTASQIQALMNKVGDDYGMQSQIQDITQGMDKDTLTKFGHTLDMCIKGGTYEGFLTEMHQAKEKINGNSNKEITGTLKGIELRDVNKDGKIELAEVPEAVRYLNQAPPSQGAGLAR